MSIYHLSSLTNLCKIDFLQDYLHVPYQLPIFHKNRRIQKLESCINSGKFKQNHCDKDCPCQIIWEHSIISPDYLAIRQFDFDLLSSVNVLRLGNGCIPFWWYGPETKSWWYINLHANPERTVTFMNLLLLLLLFCFFCFLFFFYWPMKRRILLWLGLYFKKMWITYSTVAAFMVRNIILLNDIFSIFSPAGLNKLIIYFTTSQRILKQKFYMTGILFFDCFYQWSCVNSRIF